MENIINFISDFIPVFFIGITIVYGLMEKKDIFELFKSGVYEGLKIVYRIFPILLGLFVSINIINISGFLDYIGKILGNTKIPSEIFSLLFMRSISGSGSIAIVNSIFEKFGVDSIYSLFASIMLGSTETTIYSIMMYSSSFKNKNYKFKDLILIGLLSDFIAICLSFLYVKSKF